MDMPILSSFVTSILEQASVVALVLDYASLNGTAQAELQETVEETLSVLKQETFVFVNKFDQRIEGAGEDLDEEGVRTFVSETVMCGSGRIQRSHVFPVSAKYAQLANKARLALVADPENIPDENEVEWVEAFARIAFGETWGEDENYPMMRVMGDVGKFAMGIAAVYGASKLEAPLDTMLQ